MKATERKAMWHHSVFSSIVGLLLIGIILVRRDTAGALLGLITFIYLLGNTYIHYRHKDFRTETLYEYVLIVAAVFIVLLSSLKH